MVTEIEASLVAMVPYREKSVPGQAHFGLDVPKAF